MMPAPNWEFSDRRILAALTFVDTLGQPVLTPVRASAPGVRLMAKRPGQLVVTRAPGFDDHVAAFDQPPAMPAIGSVAVTLDLLPADPAFGPRRASLALPRDPNPANAANANSLFRPVEIVLLPTPSAAATGLVTRVRVHVRRSDDDRAVEGALVRLRPEGGLPQAMALTDAAGDAQVLVPAVPLATPGGGGVVLPDIGAELDAIVDPALALFHTPDEVMAARAAAFARETDLLDPDDLQARLAASATPPLPLRIAAGQTHTATITWVPP